MGYIDTKYLATLRRLISLIDNLSSPAWSYGLVTMKNICGVAVLGGDPYRDGSYEYYIGEIIRDNDPKGVGPFSWPPGYEMISEKGSRSKN
jgi:unsaturated rhamnogalacturonyl hydrolase